MSAMRTLGLQFAEAKLVETKHRIKELELVAKQLNLKEEYPNLGKSLAYERRIRAILDSKTEKLVKYVENNLKSNHCLADQQRPLGLAKFQHRTLRKKQAIQEKLEEASPKNKKNLNSDSKPPVSKSQIRDEVDPLLLKIDKLDVLILDVLEGEDNTKRSNSEANEQFEGGDDMDMDFQNFNNNMDTSRLSGPMQNDSHLYDQVSHRFSDEDAPQAQEA